KLVFTLSPQSPCLFTLGVDELKHAEAFGKAVRGIVRRQFKRAVRSNRRDIMFQNAGQNPAQRPPSPSEVERIFRFLCERDGPFCGGKCLGKFSLSQASPT